MDTAPAHNRMDSSTSSVKYPLAAGAGGIAGAAAGPEMSQRGMAYQNIPSEQYWADAGDNGPVRGYTANQGTGKSNRKWKIAAIVFAVVAIIAVVVGVVVSQVTKKSGNGGNTGNSGSGSSSSGNGTSGVLVGNDPSVFDKDPNLHQSFWALAYTPQEAILPNCNVQLANVTRDIQVSRQHLSRCGERMTNSRSCPS